MQVSVGYFLLLWKRILGPSLLAQLHPNSEGASPPGSAAMQPRGGWGPGACALTFQEALLLLEALRKGQRVGSPLGSQQDQHIWGVPALEGSGTWMFWGSPRCPSHMYTVTVYFLSQVSDKGLYSCKVNNAAGEAMRTFVLLIQGKPGTSLRVLPWDT